MFTSGQVPPERLDDIVRRILYGLIDSGAFDDPLPPPAADVSTPEHRAAATRIAAAGMVLLKNRRGALPLAPRPRSLALIGPTGEDAIYVIGGSAAVPPEAGQASTPRAGITARAGTGTTVTAVQGSAGDVAAPAIVPAAVLAPSSGAGAGLLGLLLEQRRPRRRSGPAACRCERRSRRGAERDGRAVVGPLDRHAHADRDGPAPLHAAARGLRDDDDRRAGVRPGVPRGDAVHRRPAVSAAGHGVAQGRRAGSGDDRVLEPARAVQPGDPLRVGDAVAVRDPRGGRGGTRAPTRRSSSPTTRRARAWTAPRSRWPATRTS